MSTHVRAYTAYGRKQTGLREHLLRPVPEYCCCWRAYNRMYYNIIYNIIIVLHPAVHRRLTDLTPADNP